jgi:hypothetical protein
MTARCYISAGQARVRENVLFTLQRIVDKNQEQEVRGIALPVVDAVLTAARKHLPSDDPVLDAIAGLVTPAAIAESEPIRAVDS